MNKESRILFCYGCNEFNRLALSNNWSHNGWDLNQDLCVVSILSSRDQTEFGEKRWFHHNTDRICLLSFCDGGLTDEDAIDMFDFSRPDVGHLYIDGDIEKYNPISAGQAAYLVRFLDRNIREGRGVMVHCSAGASRSQGIVRYILDTYPDIEWVTRRDNPCLTPNMHVVRMLKRAYNVM